TPGGPGRAAAPAPRGTRDGTTRRGSCRPGGAGRATAWTDQEPARAEPATGSGADAPTFGVRAVPRGSAQVSARTAATSARSAVTATDGEVAKYSPPTTATPSALPNCCAVTSTPAAAPARRGSTPARMTLSSAGSTRPLPKPTASSTGASG